MVEVRLVVVTLAPSTALVGLQVHPEAPVLQEDLVDHQEVQVGPLEDPPTCLVDR